MADNLVLVGKIRTAFGVKGEAKVTSFTEPPENLLDYPLQTKQGEEIQLTQSKPSADGFIARIKGVDTREDIKNIANTELFTARNNLAPLADDEYYHDDLIGFTAVTHDDENLGTVTAIFDFGAGLVLEMSKKQLVSIKDVTIDTDLKKIIVDKASLI